MQTLNRLNIDQLLVTFVLTTQHLGRDKDCLVSGLPKDRYKYLEFVGDRVLNLSVVLAYPAALRSESELLITSFSEITSNSNIGIFVATQLNFKSAKPRWIADQIEATCGALWFASHFNKVQDFAAKLVSDFIHKRQPVNNPNFLRWARQVQGKVDLRSAGQYNQTWHQEEQEEEEILVQPTQSPINKSVVTTQVLLQGLKVRSGSIEEFDLRAADDSVTLFDNLLESFSVPVEIENQLNSEYFRSLVNIVLTFTFGTTFYRAFGSGPTREAAIREAKGKAFERLKINEPELLTSGNGYETD
jgi:dsRNA-specific ribonuclease